MTKPATVQEKLSNKLSETGERLVDMGHLVKDAVQDKYHELKDLAGETYDEGKEKLEDFERSLKKRIRKSPVKSVLIAAGIGWALCFVSRRR